ncbi:hypothetical protein F511_33961 [Dorcoceras hygrometricum]|uniref:Uncharacterized protein n=1 Tax=Dorcoceras hygrometricum TaxID=472368 RepID=A0A2Z7AP84_9LAMI|nr:hypothetical protein F511_33961 [Dorcoceras hygrometricum]
MMSLFDLQDVCIVIGSLATLDSPMVVDLIVIYGLKGPYCTLTTTNWFLQALSVIPRGSWRDDGRPPPPLANDAIDPPKRRRRPPPLAVYYVIGLVSITAMRRNLPPPTVKCRFPRETGRSQEPRRQQDNNQRTPYEWFVVALVMSLFDLQDVCIAIGSIATLDLPMVVDLIGIYGLKGPYCTLTTTNWFLQALSVIPRGSWGDVARRFTMIRWAALETAAPLLSQAAAAAAVCAAAAPPSSPENCFRPIGRGESVRADLVSPSSAG